jgi:hypothetical protein
MKMANEKKSIIEEALLEAEQIDAAFKSNAKEILSQTMSSEIEEMVKESLTGSKKRLKEEDEEEEMDLDLELDTEEGEEEGEEFEEMDLDMDTEEGEESEDMDLDMDMDTEDMGMDLDLGDESEEGSEMDLDMDMDMENEPSGEEMETVDLTNVSDDSKLISVFKKMGPEDEIEVVNDNGMVTLKDNKSGSEYRIELNSTGGVSNVETSEIELGEGTEESGKIIYEIVVDDEDEMSDYMMDYASDEDEMSDYMMDYASDEDKMMDHMDYASDEDEMSSYMDYKKSGLKNPGKADLNKDHDITPYEKKRGMAIEKSMAGKDDEDEMSYMSRRVTTKGRYATGNRTNTNAINRMGGAESYKSTYGMSESKTPQITKLIKENTNLNTKLTSIESENTELKDTQEKMVEALKQFRKKLQEVAVFNSNLTYAVRLFTENSTTKEEKQEILKRLDSAKDLKESQSIYKQLVKEYTNGKATIKESIEEKINKTASSGAQISESSVFVHPELQNMKKLWEYSYKK